MQDIKFSTLTLLNIAAAVEAAYPDRFNTRKFDLDRMLEVLNDDKIFSDKDRQIIYLCFERRMTIDEIVEAVNVPTDIVNYTLDMTYLILFCFSKVYRESRPIESIAAYKLLSEGDTYLKLFGNQTYFDVAREFIRRGCKFDLDISRDHATIIALKLGFRGRDLDPWFVLSVERVACEKFNLRDVRVYDDEVIVEHYDDVEVKTEELQEFLNRALDRKIKVSVNRRH